MTTTERRGLMNRVASVVLLLFGMACAGQNGGNGSASDASPEAAEPSPTPEFTLVPPEPPELVPLGERLEIPADANIFGAGSEVAPEPGGGGAGTLPPGWILPAGSGRVVTFPKVTGSVNFWIGNADWNEPAGDKTHTTDVVSYAGISGLRYEENGSFLVGLFLTDSEPDSAPPRLDFSRPPPDELLPGVRLPELQGDVVVPEIGQTFYIGDGKDYRYAVPDEATRLFVGFVDGALWKGNPGWYGNNEGELEATVALTRE
jgi:hypothetical protein